MNMAMRRNTAAAWCAAWCVGLACVPMARATWSIVIVDRRTGEVAVGSATCLQGFDLRAGTPVVLTGIGAATAQSFVDTLAHNRTQIRDGLALGVPPESILSGLQLFDGGHQTRQYGIVDAQGRAATFTGTQAGRWAGGRTGEFGDLVYAVQGNVLTGAAVVDRAVEAIQTTPGDVPLKLMRAMQAARMMGGDGRCSCGFPADGCGTPPPGTWLSANIGYMIIARAGDIDAANGHYRAPWTVGALAVAPEASASGARDVAMIASFGPGSLVRNRTPEAARSPFALLAQGRQDISSSSQARDVALLRVNNDSLLDMIFAGGTPAGLMTSLQNANGTWAPVTRITTATGAGALATGDLNGDGRTDVIVINQPSGFSVMLSTAAGGFQRVQTYSDPGTPGFRGGALARLNDDAALDGAFVDSVNRRVLVFANQNDGSGLLNTTPTAVNVGLSPNTIEAADINGDGRTDLIVGHSAHALLTIVRNEPGGLVVQDVVSPIFTRYARAGDVNNDGRVDVVCGDNLGWAVFLNSPAGLAPDRAYRYLDAANNFPLGDFKLGDLDGDGYLDIVGITAGNLLVVENLGVAGAGRYTERIGQAAGDYFMNFNVAFATDADPDPVFRLSEQFQMWRDSLVGSPDAIRSTATFGAGCVPAGGIAELQVQLRDWQESVVDRVGLTLDVRTALESAPAIIESTTPTGPGMWNVRVRVPGDAPAGSTLRLAITARGAGRDVTLMPEARLAVVGNPDYNGDGMADFGDVLDLAHDTSGGTASFLPRTPDFNADGSADLGDVFLLASVIAGETCQ